MIGFLNRKVILFADGNNDNIIQAIIKQVPESSKQVSVIASRFKGKNNRQTASKIWGFLKFYIKYKKDSYGQEIKLPSALLKFKHGDCKSYALFTVSILKALGLPAYLRFGCYDSTKIPSHVYAYTLDEKGRKVIIDACYTYFDREKKPYSTRDFKV